MYALGLLQPGTSLLHKLVHIDVVKWNHLMQSPTPPTPAAIHTGGRPAAALLRPVHSHIFLFRRGMGMPRIPTESGVTPATPVPPIHCSSSSPFSFSTARR